MKPVRIGLIGHGVLAQRIRQHLAASLDAPSGTSPKVTATAQAGASPSASPAVPSMPATVSGVLVRRLPAQPDTVPFVDTIDAFLALGHDVVIECAGQPALRQYGEAVLRAGIDLVPASIGALVDAALLSAMLRTAAYAGARLRLPSGAIAGIDGLAAARHGGITSVLYRGTMPPHALHGHVAVPDSPRQVVFEGTAREAVARFPKNANLTGTISLAGIGFDRTRVEIIVDAGVSANIHELHVDGGFGRFSVAVQGNRISPASPSSQIVAGSLAQAALGSNFTLIALPPSTAAPD